PYQRRDAIYKWLTNAGQRHNRGLCLGRTTITLPFFVCAQRDARGMLRLAETVFSRDQAVDRPLQPLRSTLSSDRCRLVWKENGQIPPPGCRKRLLPCRNRSPQCRGVDIALARASSAHF